MWIIVGGFPLQCSLPKNAKSMPSVQWKHSDGQLVVGMLVSTMALASVSYRTVECTLGLRLKLEQERVSCTNKLVIFFISERPLSWCFATSDSSCSTQLLHWMGVAVRPVDLGHFGPLCLYYSLISVPSLYCVFLWLSPPSLHSFSWVRTINSSLGGIQVPWWLYSAQDLPLPNGC